MLHVVVLLLMHVVVLRLMHVVVLRSRLLRVVVLRLMLHDVLLLNSEESLKLLRQARERVVEAVFKPSRGRRNTYRGPRWDTRGPRWGPPLVFLSVLPLLARFDRRPAIVVARDLRDLALVDVNLDAVQLVRAGSIVIRGLKNNLRPPEGGWMEG